MFRLLQARAEIAEMVRNWRTLAEDLAQAAKRLLGLSTKVILFGSVAQGKATGGSDIDILIVSERLPASYKERGELAARLEEEAGFPLYHPVEIHMASPKEAEQNPIYRQALRTGITI